MLDILLQQIRDLISKWFTDFTTHAQHVENKLDSLDQTASDIKTDADNLPDIKDNTAAVITPVQNIKSNTDSIATSSQTSANNTTAILNNISTLSTNTGRAAAYAQDCANNTLEIKDKITTIASDTTQLRADSAELNDMSDKIYEAIKWSLADKYIDETESGPSPISFDTDIADDLKSLKIGIIGSQSGSGDPSPSNVRPISGYSNMNITVNGNSMQISLGQTVFNGVLDLISGKLKINNSYLIFNGSENWQTYAVQNGFYISAPNVSTLIPDTISNMFLSVASYSNYGIRVSAQGERYYFCQITNNISGITDLTSWKNWLSNNNVEVVSKLIMPIEVQLTAQQIAAIKGVNTITSDTNGDIEVTYKESIKHYLDKQDN